MDDFSAFARLVAALRPWLQQLVIVGGWAHRLYWLHPLADPPPYTPVRTRDADVAFSLAERLSGDIGSALVAANFKEELSSDHTPPVSHFQLGDGDQGFYAEFLAPLHGSGVKRTGAADATVTRAGVTAQKLRHLDVLLTSPWSMHLTADVDVEFTVSALVRIANPAAFIVQKLLIQKQRPPAKRAQDALYIYDTLQLFGSNLEQLNLLWNERIRPALPTATVNRVIQLAREQFGTVTDTIRTAARIPADRVIDPQRMQAACSLGLEELFEVAPGPGRIPPTEWTG